MVAVGGQLQGMLDQNGHVVRRDSEENVPDEERADDENEWDERNADEREREATEKRRVPAAGEIDRS